MLEESVETCEYGHGNSPSEAAFHSRRRWIRLEWKEGAADSCCQCKSFDVAPGGGDDGEGNYALKDYIRAQILRRWLPDLSIPGARNMPVLVKVRLLKNGVIDDVAIVDQQRFHLDKVFRDMALSARDAALLASPIQIPGTRYEKTQTLTISLDPKAVLR